MESTSDVLWKLVDLPEDECAPGQLCMMAREQIRTLQEAGIIDVEVVKRRGRTPHIIFVLLIKLIQDDGNVMVCPVNQASRSFTIDRRHLRKYDLTLIPKDSSLNRFIRKVMHNKSKAVEKPHKPFDLNATISSLLQSEENSLSGDHFNTIPTDFENEGDEPEKVCTLQDAENAVTAARIIYLESETKFLYLQYRVAEQELQAERNRLGAWNLSIVKLENLKKQASRYLSDLKSLANDINYDDLANERKFGTNDFHISTCPVDVSGFPEIEPDEQNTVRLPLYLPNIGGIRPKKVQELKETWATGEETSEIQNRKIYHSKLIPIWNATDRNEEKPMQLKNWELHKNETYENAFAIPLKNVCVVAYACRKNTCRYWRLARTSVKDHENREKHFECKHRSKGEVQEEPSPSFKQIQTQTRKRAASSAGVEGGNAVQKFSKPKPNILHQSLDYVSLKKSRQDLSVETIVAPLINKEEPHGECISSYLDLIETQHSRAEEFFFFDADFFEFLVVRGLNMSTYLSRVSAEVVLSKRKWIIPVNYPANHWVLVVIDLTVCHLNYYDTLNSTRPMKQLEKIIKFVCGELKRRENVDVDSSSFQILFLETPQQKVILPNGNIYVDNTACGVMVLELVKRIVGGQSIKFSVTSVPKLRSSIAIQLHNKRLIKV